MTENLYEQLLPYWMEYQWALRDEQKVVNKLPPWSDERMDAHLKTEEALSAWLQRILQITGRLQYEDQPDGSCVVAGTMLFNVY